MTDVFFSYSHEDADNNYFRTFFDAFAEDLRAYAITYFRDEVNIKLGKKWSPELIGALMNAKVFVYLLSPNLLKSDYCGRELKVFQDRVTAANARVGNPEHFDGTIIPIWWTPIDFAEAPRVISERQVSHLAFPSSYKKKGLRSILRSNRKDFRTSIESLVESIKTALKLLLPSSPQRPSLDAVTSIFKSPEGQLRGKPAAAPFRGPGSESKGPRDVCCIYVAASSDIISDIREHVAQYDTGEAYWAPYTNEPETRASIIAQRAAAGANLTLSNQAFPEDLESFKAILDGYRERRVAVAFIIDPWTVSLERYASMLFHIETSQNDYNCCRVFAWDLTDAETAAEQETLFERVKDVFRRSWESSPSTTLDQEFGSSQELSNELQKRLTAAKLRIIQMTAPLRSINAGRFRNGPPSISGH